MVVVCALLFAPDTPDVASLEPPPPTVRAGVACARQLLGESLLLGGEGAPQWLKLGRSAMLHVPAMRPNSTTQAIDLSGAGLADGAAATVAILLERGAPALRSLSLEANAITGEGVATLVAALEQRPPRNRTLEALYLLHNRIGADGGASIGGALRRGLLPRLAELHLDWNFLGDAGVAGLSAGIRGHPLRQLWLADNRVGSAGMRALATALTVSRDPSGGAAGVGGGDGLAELCLNDNPDVGDEGVAALAAALAVGGAPRLRALYLSGVGVGRRGAEALAGALGAGGAPMLEELHLDRNPRLGDRGAAALARALRRRGPQRRDGGGASGGDGLRVLQLASSGVGERGIEALGRAAKRGALTQLRQLHLGHLAGAGADRAVVALGSALRAGALPRLRYLSVSTGTRGAHDAGEVSTSASASASAWAALAQARSMKSLQLQTARFDE